MALNEFQVSLHNGSHRLRTSLKGLGFHLKSLDSVLDRFDLIRYSQFTVLPTPLGRMDQEEMEDGEKQYSVFVPLDRNRLSLLDSLWFYPFAFYITYSTVNWYFDLRFDLLSGLSILEWYMPFYQQLIGVLGEFMSDTYANSFILVIPVALIIELSIMNPLYLALKPVLSWVPSFLWRFFLIVFTGVRQ